MPTTTSSTALPTSSSFVLISEASAAHNFWKALARLNVLCADELESLPAVMALYAPSTALIASFKRFRSALIWHAVSSRSEEHTSELQSQSNLVCRLLLEKKKGPRTLSVWSAQATAPPLLD